MILGYNSIRKRSKRRWKRSKIEKKQKGIGGRRKLNLCRTTHRVKSARLSGSIENRLIPKICCIFQTLVLNKNRRTFTLIKNPSNYRLWWKLNRSRQHGLPSLYDNLQKSAFCLVSSQRLVFNTWWFHHFEVHNSQTYLCDRRSELTFQIPKTSKRWTYKNGRKLWCATASNNDDI